MKLQTKILFGILLASVLVSLAGAGKSSKNEKKKLQEKLKKLAKSYSKRHQYECVPTIDVGICKPTRGPFKAESCCKFKTDPSKTQLCCTSAHHDETCVELTHFPHGVWCDCGTKLCKTTTTEAPPPPPTGGPTVDVLAESKEFKDATKAAPNPAPTAPPFLNRPLKCYSCEATQGDSSGSCKDNPKSTKIAICKPGQVCRSVSFISESRGGSVIIRGCADDHDTTPIEIASSSRRKGGSKGKKPKRKNHHGQSKRKGAKRSGIPRGCTVNPPFLGCPDGDCNHYCPNGDCDHYSCSCTCEKHFCNKAVGMGQGWDLCAQQ